MKLMLNLLCTIAIVLVQCMTTAAPLLPAAAARCACCGCKGNHCCASQDLPDAPAVPAPPLPSQQQPDLRFTPSEITRFLAPVLPDSDARAPVPADASGLGAIPLFTRDCARRL